jgi:hypothetical protein
LDFEDWLRFVREVEVLVVVIKGVIVATPVDSVRIKELFFDANKGIDV